MTSTPESPVPTDGSADDVGIDQPTGGAPGAEIGMSEGEGSTFEPEEDPEPEG